MNFSQELLIVKGIAPALGDTASNEEGQNSINLLSDPNLSGWSLGSEEGWDPLQAALKGGGVWADSAIAPGRTLVAGEQANVVETMSLTLTADSILDLVLRITTMNRMIEDCRTFWTTFYQIEPVYLRWWAQGAPGPQFALLYNIEMAITEPDVWQTPIRDVTLTLEREPYWRGLPPGTNPKVWSYLARGEEPTSTTDDNLTNEYVLAFNTTVTGNLFSDTVDNNDRQSNVNYVEISADDIPGDVPPLVQLTVRANAGASPNHIFLAVRAEPFEYPNISASQSFISTYEASDGTNGTDASDVADGNAASGTRVDISFATVTTDALRITFPAIAVPPMVGHFAAYLRAYQNAGAAGDIAAHLEVLVNSGFVSAPQIELPEVQFEVGVTQFPMVYMGMIEMPLNGRIPVSASGKGITDEPYSIVLYARERVATAATLRVADLVLMPMDIAHGYAHVTLDTAKTIQELFIDNTGYFAHGSTELMTRVLDTSQGGSVGVYEQSALVDYRGQALSLVPGVANRIYVIRYFAAANGEPDTLNNIGIRGNIVPRWRFIRNL